MSAPETGPAPAEAPARKKSAADLASKVFCAAFHHGDIGIHRPPPDGMAYGRARLTIYVPVPIGSGAGLVSNAVLDAIDAAPWPEGTVLDGRSFWAPKPPKKSKRAIAQIEALDRRTEAGK